jgi:tetratricopeptide (TPR) repeat protein
LFELARPSFEKATEEAPLSADRHANLGWFYAFAGRKDDAIREGRRAVELKPESKDAVDGAIMNCYLALIYARVGEKELAIPLIERLLKTPGAVDSVDYSITVNDLKHRWEWDPIRNDPSFRNWLAERTWELDRINRIGLRNDPAQSCKSCLLLTRRSICLRGEHEPRVFLFRAKAT